jgi:hypothetical protein
MDVGILGEIDRFKPTALRQTANRVAHPEIMLVSRSGFEPMLHEAASRDPRIRPIGIAELADI